MLTKIKLFYQIKKFYKIYGEDNFINSLSDMTSDNLYDVLFDINEALEANSTCFCSEAYDLDIWLNNLYDSIESFRNAKSKVLTNLITILGVALILWFTISTVEVISKNITPNPQYSDANAWVVLLGGEN